MRFADLTLSFLLSSNLLLTHVLGLSESLGSTSITKIGLRSALLLGVFMPAGVLFTSLYLYVLVPLQLTILATAALVVCLALVHLGYTALRRSTKQAGWPEPREVLFHTLLIGGVLFVAQTSTDLLDFTVISLSGVAGYALGLVLLQSVFVRMARERLPVLFQGLPFQLVTVGLVWLMMSGLGIHFVGKAG